MRGLWISHSCFYDEINKNVVDPLILIPAFICDFLCIHPFNDGNGRMSRLLTLLFLYKSEYEVGKYISIENLLACYTESEERIGVMDDAGVKSHAYDVVKIYADNKLGKFTAADVLANCGKNISFQCIKKLTQEGYIEKYGERQKALYIKKSTSTTKQVQK